MNKEWSELNKTMQMQLKKEDTFPMGIASLFFLRDQLMLVWNALRNDLSRDDFNAMPYMNAEGCHSTTVAWSLWHILRIEDIVAHTLICGDQQVFFAENYQARIHAPIITTGNELVKSDIADFSKELDIDALYAYMSDVINSTDRLLNDLRFDMMKHKIPDSHRAALCSLHVVSEDERAAWLTDYWCGKDIRGLIQMPFSRHWIMHTEAALRIQKKLYP
ncbi:MAG: phage head-tail adapter protein [Oscillospiraceae bacterium]|nr:phage head-tail adapter protein [Oscillospiraceae bacterium]